ncbi:Zinc ABC transporter, periplasmic-binding protein ZnuA [hydrothermal vent metagenome]|uniref:Zinc ABC transporter, periplasmic-binding protein ZnuA n=1 Tax=hydrothermal vent metagenome TaxID=652676 RepID=A0A3B0WIF5_9ZZZZ
MSLTLKHIVAYLTLLIIPCIAFSASSEKNLQEKNLQPIVVTIKPLYSLVAQLSEGIEQPILLMKQMQSPHHYTMRPSERRLLANARIIVWIGPQMETYLSKVIQQQDAVIISAMQASGLNFLKQRFSRQHLSGQHSSGQHFSRQQNNTKQNHLTANHLDPHIWLSADNTIVISKHIAQQLIASNPENTATYKKNLQQLISKITQLKNEIKTNLKDNAQPFITHHDAFQYFENENNLNYIASISFDEESSVSLKHLRQIKTSIKKNNVQCLVYQPPKPDIIEALADKTKIKTAALDPLGSTLSPGPDNEKNAWFKIMRSIELNFKRCLSQ